MDDPAARPERVCDFAGCMEEADHRAPKSNAKLDEYYWFCFQHASVYNRSWDYFQGMDQEEIENEPNNVTRFLIFSKQQTEPTSNDKTSIIFSINHEPSSLYGIIKEFSNNNTNLTKIESRPKKGTAWEYNFYLDFVGHISDKKISSMLDGLKKNTKFLKIIGSYPLAELS